MLTSPVSTHYSTFVLTPLESCCFSFWKDVKYLILTLCLILATSSVEIGVLVIVLCLIHAGVL